MKPRHISFIMDGNGRWAKQRGKLRQFGHRAGTETLKKVLIDCHDLGISEVTFYAFSTENWRRPAHEVKLLMALLDEYLRSQIDEIHEAGVVFRAIGNVDALAPSLIRLIRDAEKRTANNPGIRFNVCVNYGGRNELVEATKRIAQRVASGELRLDQIDEATIEASLYLSNPPDLMIRTGGEKRLSNFLLWQHAYAEFIFLDTLWPDFSRADLENCLAQFEGRERRFGALNED
ncbi:MAG: polyprenyl diphosphate synthase [Bacillota bacterium]|nr:polyprenyl diphosphate synthase [Bacillota bacterium]